MRTVAVVSGKGGVGKTTLCAVFACFASADGPVVLADCDVEASNLPLALGVQEESRKLFTGGLVATIEPNSCLGCGACVPYCRFDAIHAPDLEAPGVPCLAYTVDPSACEGCGACMSAECPNMSIRMTPRDTGELVTGRGATGPVVFGELFPGQDLSGKLVSEVRKRAAKTAAGMRAQQVLVDGPPGVGCPVIASLAAVDGVVAVTEPSVSGAHDLARVVELARRFDIEPTVVLNKADLSDHGADLIRTYAEEAGLDLVAEIPFDPEFAALLGRLADGEDPADVVGGTSSGAALAACREAWESVNGTA